MTGEQLRFASEDEFSWRHTRFFQEILAPPYARGARGFVDLRAQPIDGPPQPHVLPPEEPQLELTLLCNPSFYLLCWRMTTKVCLTLSGRQLDQKFLRNYHLRIQGRAAVQTCRMLEQKFIRNYHLRIQGRAYRHLCHCLCRDRPLLCQLNSSHNQLHSQLLKPVLRRTC